MNNTKSRTHVRLFVFCCLAFQVILLYISQAHNLHSAVTLETIRVYCLAKPGNITEDFPFDEEVLVFKVHGRIFLLTSIFQRPLALNLKADPEQALEWRGQYEAVQPGYHMNKRLWNTVTLDGSIRKPELLVMIDHSYEQVVKGLKKSERERIFKQLNR